MPVLPSTFRSETAQRVSRAVAGLIALVALTAAGQETGSNTDLDTVRRDVEQTEQAIRKQTGARTTTAEELERIEADIDNTLTRQRNVKRQVRELSEQLKQHRGEIESARASLDANRDAVETLVRNLYAQGRQSELKLLLGAADPVRLGRSLVWYRYVARARSEAVENLRDQINRIRAIEAKITGRETELARLTKRLDEDEIYLTGRRKKKQKLLTKIESTIAEKSAELEALREAERELTAVLKRAAREEREKQPAPTPTPEPASEPDTTQPQRPQPSPARSTEETPTPGGVNFASLQGTLPYPADGPLTARFGERRHEDSDIEWKGILIDASPGDPVKAIADGTVVLAERRKGYGEMVLVQHIGGYHTAYMQLDELQVSRGDAVTAGDMIATVGSTGLSEPGLYFLIRNDSTGMVDPMRWLKPR